MDGVTSLRHLRTRKLSMPILVLTSRNRVDRVECLDLGADDFLSMPFSQISSWPNEHSKPMPKR